MKRFFSCAIATNLFGIFTPLNIYFVNNSKAIYLTMFSISFFLLLRGYASSIVHFWNIPRVSPRKGFILKYVINIYVAFRSLQLLLVVRTFILLILRLIHIGTGVEQGARAPHFSQLVRQGAPGCFCFCS